MEDYLEYNGWHFNKKMCDFATSRMYKMNGNRTEFVKPFTKEQVDQLLAKYEMSIKNDKGYDAVFVMNMARADYWDSSIQDELHLVRFVKDYIDDPDGYDGLPFTRYYADCIGNGTPINWEDMI